MSDHPLQSFIELVDFDRELAAVQDARAKLKQEIDELKALLVQEEQNVQQAQLELSKARKDVDVKELEMKELEEQRTKEKERLETVANAKQYQAIKSEIASLNQKQSEFDELLLNAWNTLEAAQKSYESLQQSSAERVAEQQEQIKEKEQAIQEKDTIVEKMMDERPGKEEAVPQEWLERYQAMRSRVSNPVVPIVKASCSACFWPVPNQDMLRLKRKEVLQCKGCYRFLYMPQEQQEESSADTTHEDANEGA